MALGHVFRQIHAISKRFFNSPAARRRPNFSNENFELQLNPDERDRLKLVRGELEIFRTVSPLMPDPNLLEPQDWIRLAQTPMRENRIRYLRYCHKKEISKANANEKKTELARIRAEEFELRKLEDIRSQHRLWGNSMMQRINEINMNKFYYCSNSKISKFAYFWTLNFWASGQGFSQIGAFLVCTLFKM